MSSPPLFHQRFNIQVDIEEAKRRFVNRIYNDIYTHIFYEGNLSDVFRERAKKAVASKLGRLYTPGQKFKEIIGQDFIDCLRSIEGLYAEFKNYLEIGPSIHRIVKNWIADSEYDLGVKWEDGHFKPVGAKVLDDALVNDNLKWLKDQKFVSIYKPFEKALMHYSESVSDPSKLKDVVTEMFEALEATAKYVTGRNEKLDALKQQFISLLGLTPFYEKMLKEYIVYAHEHARHAANPGKSPYSFPKSETENFIYLTGIFIRFSIEKLKEGNRQENKSKK